MGSIAFRLALAVALLVAALSPAAGQFGQNKISYQNFDWHVYHSPHFDVHYYPEEEAFLEEIVSDAESAYVKISKDLDHELRFRVPLIVYKTHGEFQQTNVVLGDVPAGVAAFAEPVQYRMVLPIDEPPDKLYHLIAHELVHIFQYSMFFEGYLGRAIRSNPPLWLMEGMASYLAEDEDNLDRMAIRDAVVNNILPPIEQLTTLSFLTYRYGHAIFDFIEQEHGKEGMRSFLFEFKKVLLTGNIAKAIKESFGYDVQEFDRRFNRYLRKKYFPVLLDKKSPDDYGTEIGLRRRDGVFTFSPTLSPSGELVASLSSPKLELDLIVLSAEDGRKVRNLTKGWTNRYSELVAEAFAGKRDLSWSPVADQVAVFGRKENKWPLLIFNALTGKLERQISFPDIFQCASPTFSPDGRRVAFEGNRGGIVDIFEVNLDDGTLRSITADDFFDANPWYAADGKSMLYNRRIGSHWKIFSVDLTDPTKKTQLTFGPHSDIQPSYSRDGRTVFFSSDEGEYGVFNIHALDLETGDIVRYTDVVGGCFTPVEMAPRGDERNLVFTAFFEGTFKLYRMPLRAPEATIPAAERLSAPVEVRPFEPTMTLSVDESAKTKYKLKWDIEAPSIGVGLTDDGTFLADAAIQFTDLLGNHRIYVSAQSVSDFASYQVAYANLKHRFNWGAMAYNFSDYFVDQVTGQRVKREYGQTGVEAYLEYPINRYYRVRSSVGAVESTQNQLFLVDQGGFQQVEFFGVKDRLGLIRLSLTGDTTRYQSYWPFQGKRLFLEVNYGPHISGDFPSDLLEYRLDFRTYKQLTRRSLLAWRVASIYTAGDRDNTYGFGGLNQLRGYDYRQFFGSRLAWSNLELRFPFVDEMRFPFIGLQQFRGVLFFDIGAAWYQQNVFYDPDLVLPGSPYQGNFRLDPQTGLPIPFEIWDSENNRLQDARASYGWGFQFVFIGGLQLNWVWSRRVDYTQFVPGFDEFGAPALVKSKADTGGTRGDFYIMYDW